MAGTNLTRDEARERSELVRVSSYHIDLDFSASTADAETFRSETTIRFTASRPGASTFLDLVAPFVREVTCNGRALDPEQVYANGRIRLDGLSAENTVRVLADCTYSNTGQGLHRTIDPADGKVYLYTHFEPADARRVYANFEQPDIKASFAFTVHAPAGWEAFSNSPTPEPTTDGSTLSWRFAPTPRQSTYITAIVAGEYHVERDSHTTFASQVIPLAVACRASMAPYLDAAETFDTVKKGFDYFVRRFGRAYPFAKYDQVFVPEYNIGAMENVGCVTVNDTYLFRSQSTDADHQRRNEMLLHELAHMWFGDLVTMRWWDDTWLKESFATYMAALCTAEATRWAGAWTTFATTGKARALRQDELPSTHPIEADIANLDDVAANFDGITYDKGASVLKQLVAWVGEDAFFAGVKSYFDEHEYGNTTLADLLSALEKTSGRDLSQWSREWLRTAGPNTLRPFVKTSGDGVISSFAVAQEASEAYPTLRSHRIAIGFYTRSDGALIRTHRHELDVTGERTEVAELAGLPRPDLVMLNDDDLAYAKIRFDDESMETLQREGVASIAESLPRALAWGALWDMVRNAEASARDYVRLAMAGAAREPATGAIESLHANVLIALDRYVARDAVAAVRADVASTARARAFDTEPGSDAQLAWVRLFLRTAASDDDLALIAGLRDGARTIEGVAIDTDLRWALATALARCGRIGPPEVSEELTADHTTAGAERAMAVLATRPSAEAKAEAWAQIMDTAETTNGVIRAIVGAGRNSTGAGFSQATQTELLQPYVELYFKVLADLWENRPHEIASLISTGLYPSLLVTPDVIARTDAYLAKAAAPATLRRILLEGRDDVERALRAQELDAIAS
jgi:aminopeptidase N